MPSLHKGGENMAETIRGINVVIGADTTKLSKALADVNQKSKDIQSELRQVERLLKFDPSNTTLLAQKQQLLSQAIENTSEKLNRLKSVQQQVNEQFQRGEISEGQYRAFQREVEKTEGQLRSLQNRLEETNGAINKHTTAWGKLQEKLSTVGNNLRDVGQRMQNVGQSMAASFGAATAAIGGALGFAVKKSMDFEAQLDRVGAVAGATPTEIKKLEQAALDLGASTSKSATEVAQGMEIMAAMGYNTNQILAAMPGIISAAEASGEDMALVAETVSAALNAFGLSASEASRVADVLAQAANDSAAGVQDMQYTFKYAAPVAKQLGISLEQLAAATEIMSNAGIKGEQAGTTLRSALLRLSDPPKEAAEALAELGVKITDSSGKMLPFGKIIEQIKNKTEGMGNAQKTAALSAIFGTEAVSGMLAVVEAGPQKLEQLTKSLQNSAGASQEAAAKMKDNLKGSLEELQGAFETAQITIGNALAPAIEKVAGYIQNLINWFNNLSPSTQQFIATAAAVAAVLAGVGAAIGVVLAIIGAAASGIGALTTAFGAVSGAIAAAGGMAGVFSAAIAAITGPVGIAIAAIAGLIAIGVAVYKNWDTIKAKAIEIWGAIKDWFSQTLESIKQFFNNAWNNIKSFTSSTWDSIKQTTVNVWNAIKTGVMAIITPFINGITNLFNGMKSGLQTIFEGLKQYFNGVWQLIKNIFLGAVLLIVDLVTGDFEALKNDAKAIFENLKNALSNIWEGIKKVFSGAVEAIKGFVSTAWENIKSTTSTVWNGIKSLASSVWNGIKSAVSSAVESAKTAVSNAFSSMKSAVSSIMSSIKSTIVSMWNSAVNFLKGIDLVEIGKDIIRGLANGISSMASAVVEKVKSIANSVTKTIRNILDIHSPSRVMMEIGRFTVQGLIVGMEQEIDNLVKTTEKMSDALVPDFRKAIQMSEWQQKEMTKIAKLGAAERIQTVEQWLSKQYELENIQAKDEVAIWDYVLKNFKLNAEDRKRVSLNLRDAKRKVDQEIFESEKKWIEERKRLNQLSLMEELRAWEQVSQRYAEGSQKRIEAEQNALRVRQEIYNQLKTASDEYLAKVKEVNENVAKEEQRLNEEYEQAVAQRTKAISDFVGLFDQVTKNADVSGQQLLENLRGQVSALEEWSANLQSLAQRGIDEGLLAELQQMGPKASVEIAALNTLTDEQLAEYVALWKEKNQLARQEAEKELSGMREDVNKKIEQLHSDAANKLEELKLEWISKVQEVRTGTKDEFNILTADMPRIGEDIINGLISGIDAMKGSLFTKAQEIADTIKSTIQSALDIHSPSRVMMELGKWIPIGLAEGINRNINAVVSATNRMVRATIPNVAGYSSAGIPATATINVPKLAGAKIENHFHFHSTAPTPSEVARKTRQVSRQLAMEWGL
jgi:TP901 family phage tail tape measure protein